ncbi:uncharacterized protein LOC118416503 [Branchiostoma floridae]|uniref:Uncharacterized protein LOC118416503 n=1 Tax=Branchiostoma floridae TaxID=7739 RepID=A0A9J7L7C4_BRAFL|nr:uncharacterized protein LOC118416503 [Branchiostoma floridae]
MDGTATPVSSKRKRYCGHCKAYKPARTYFRHKNDYFNAATGQWKQAKADETRPARPLFRSPVNVPDPLLNSSSSSAESDSDAETTANGDQSSSVVGASPCNSSQQSVSSSDESVSIIFMLWICYKFLVFRMYALKTFVSCLSEIYQNDLY